MNQEDRIRKEFLSACEAFKAMSLPNLYLKEGNINRDGFSAMGTIVFLHPRGHNDIIDNQCYLSVIT